jgi:hypothetical protein
MQTWESGTESGCDLAAGSDSWSAASATWTGSESASESWKEIESESESESESENASATSRESGACPRETLATMSGATETAEP